MVDRRLGRGLDFFLSGSKGNPPPPPGRTDVADLKKAPEKATDQDIVQADVGSLVPSPYQPRRVMGEAELKELADSVRASGILQPILVRRVGDAFEIVAGERRWRAAQLAGLTKVPVLVRPISDQDSAVFGLVENLQREDLNAIDKAQGFKLLMTKLGASQEEVAKRVGLERSTVANFIRLLDLPAEVQAHVSRGTLSMGHARSLLALSDGDVMNATATECIKQGWSVRALEAKVKEALEQSKGDGAAAVTAKPGRARPVWLNELEESLVEALGTPVTIRYGRKRSQIVIDCAGRDEFERVYQRVKNSG